MNKTYCVYILASRSRNLYTGVTSNLHKRMIEHRQGLLPGFTTRYRIFRLVHFEEFADVRAAIAREKEIKAWRREKKIRLVESSPLQTSNTCSLKSAGTSCAFSHPPQNTDWFIDMSPPPMMGTTVIRISISY